MAKVPTLLVRRLLPVALVILTSSIRAQTFEFSPVGPFPLASNVAFQERTDLDGDGLPDFVFGHLGSAMLTIVYGDGPASVGAPVTLDLPFNPVSVTPADLDSDGVEELLVAGLVTPVVSVFEDVGGQYVIAADVPTSSLPSDGVAADFDADGDLDFAIALVGDPTLPGQVEVFPGNGFGGFDPPTVHPIGANPLHLVAEDLDDDGVLDLLAACAGIPFAALGEISVLLGDGAGGFLVGVPVAITSAIQLATGDLDGNGLLDLAVIENPSGFACDADIQLYLSTGPGVLDAGELLSAPCGPKRVEIADFDADGDADLLAGDGGDFLAIIDTLYIFANDGTGLFAAPEMVETGIFAIVTPSVADFDGDTLPDFALPLADFTGGLMFFLNETVAVTPAFLRGDVNGDETIDVADAVFALGSLFVPGAPEPPCLDAADANDDGGFDISDPIFELSALFVVGSPPIPPPNPDCGMDPTADALGCLIGCP